MNLLTIILIVILIGNVGQGYKRGMVKSIISLVSMIISCAVLVLLGNGLHSYLNGKTVNVVLAVMMLMIISIIHHMLGVVFFSAKILSKLPVVSWADKLLGIVVGLLETILVIWTIYTISMMMDLGMIGQMLMEYTKENEVLVWLYQHNYLAYLLAMLSAKLELLPALL